ncbi:hypothetical protein ES705_21767 [subsurface metagenome]
MYDFRFGLIWTFTYTGSILPFFYFKTGIIDPWFNLFIFLGIYFWVFAYRSQKLSKEILLVFLSAATLGLAILTKGPVALMVFLIIAGILFLFNGFRLGLNWKSILVFTVALVIVGGFWFLLQFITGNGDVIIDFFHYQIRLFQTKDAGHGGFPLFHLIILLFGVFPASVFAIQGHRYRGPMDTRKFFHISMIVLLWTVLVLFSIVKTKIVHYSSLSYFPVTYLAAYAVYRIIDGKTSFFRWQKIMLGVIGGIEAILIILLPVFIANKHSLISKGFITHSFTIGNLQADPGWSTFHSLIGLVLITGLFLSFFIIKRNKALQLGIIYISSLLFIYLAIVFITPGAEKISQRAAIDFIKETSKEDVYIHSFYKSYATLFYGNKPPPEDKRVFNTEWLTKGDIDKDAYFIIRIDKKDEVLAKYSNIDVIYEKNGYVFCKRPAKPDE